MRCSDIPGWPDIDPAADYTKAEIIALLAMQRDVALGALKGALEGLQVTTSELVESVGMVDSMREFENQEVRELRARIADLESERDEARACAHDAMADPAPYIEGGFPWTKGAKKGATHD